MHLTDVEEKKWMMQQAIHCQKKKFSNELRLKTFDNLTKT